MSYIWSPEKKFSTWRRLWIALAKAEKELGAWRKRKEREIEIRDGYHVVGLSKLSDLDTPLPLTTRAPQASKSRTSRSRRWRRTY